MHRLATAAFALLFVAACTADEPAKRDRPAKTRRDRPKLEPPPPEPEPSTPEPPAPEPPQPTVELPPSQWWCLCYQREGAEGPEPMTACRELASECDKLAARVEKGSKEIIAGSLTFGCRPLTGRHPSDAAGTPEQWQPSKLAGAWVSEGVCQLRAAPAADLDDTPEAVVEPEAGDSFALMNGELIGELGMDASSAKVRHSLGAPESLGGIEEQGATGEWLQEWSYPDGLTLTMMSTTRSGPQVIGAVTITAPSVLKTRRGIGIGDPRETVERAYGDVRAPEDEHGGGDGFTAGSIYGGLHFSFEDDAVSQIFLGAAAE